MHIYDFYANALMCVHSHVRECFFFRQSQLLTSTTQFAEPAEVSDRIVLQCQEGETIFLAALADVGSECRVAPFEQATLGVILEQ